MEMTPPLPIFPDLTKPGVVASWREKFEKGVLSCTHFKEHWRLWVPKLLSPDPNGNCLEWNFDEERTQKILFDSLEEFICNGDPQEIFKSLSQMENPPSVCGRVFKMGEPTYNCRECAMDASCVFCVDCFKKSPHRLHKYKMGTSNGGGCCDCGDIEAWKKEPYCDIHIAGIQNRQATVKVLPSDTRKRARITFYSILNYTYQLLTIEHSPGLPAELRLHEAQDNPIIFLDTPDTYCTVLYNDETHTFEQVISTLARVIKCSQRDAIEFVTNIDREGRAVVKCSTFQHCTQVKSEIEKFTSRHGNRALKALVVHAHVVAHQLFALRLLTWLQKILMHSEGFRSLFCEEALKPRGTDPCIVEGILRRDSNLWKSARLHWHRLFISGMMMEYESKKTFARVFAKNYGSIMKDFIRDDHDHSFSVASLAVQVFTVPTLAHYLIADEDVIFILLNTFVSECARKVNKQNKLEFEKNIYSNTFKRAQYVLYDLRYLLGVVPEVWTDNLRKGVLHGVTLILKLLSYMQGMDTVTRQVGQHMEYEPEWESAFNLHIKLAPVITQMLKWCGTDRVVLIKAYRATLKKLIVNAGFDPNQIGEVRELADHSASCIQFDVSSQPVSIHLPLSRFLAGLHLHLEKFGLHFDSSEFQLPGKHTPEQIIEPVLRTQVMISQVHAGMWRRNGYSLLNQIYFYHNVKCRSEMLDRDIVLLQIGASLIESNEFLIHVLNKFNLINWANPLFDLKVIKNHEEDSLRQVTNLVEEFLSLLIQIVGERYVIGVGKVTPEDCIKKEIIQQLCVKPLPHSELNKTLPDDGNHETGLESVINEVAVFKKPSQSFGKGVYELMKQYYNDYNTFFYHYTKEELSRSEEEQRKRRKAAGELECCPPPQLPELTMSFNMIANLLQCDVMLHVMQIVLERSLNLRAQSFSEAQLHKVLHLIGYALHEEEKKTYSFFIFTERAEKWKLESLIEELIKSPRVECHKDLLIWTLNKFRQVSAFHKPAKTESEDAPAQQESSPLQSNNLKDKERRALLAKQQREKIMAQMKAQQKNFMQENAKLFEETEATKTDDLDESMDVVLDVWNEYPVALGVNQTARAVSDTTYTCILCQEDQKVTADGPAMVLAAFVQKSTVLCRNRSSEENLDDSALLQDPYNIPSSYAPTPHASTCGHVMHSTCWLKYFENVFNKENRRPSRSVMPTVYDVEKDEYLCPLCESLSNTVLPLIPPLHTLQQKVPEIPEYTLDSYIEAVNVAINYKKHFSSKKPKLSSCSSDADSAPSSSKSPEISEASLSRASQSNDSSFSQPAQADAASVSEQTGEQVLSDYLMEESANIRELSPEVVTEYSDGEMEVLDRDYHFDDEVVMQIVYLSAPPNPSQPKPSNSAQSSTDVSNVISSPILSDNLLHKILMFAKVTYTKGLGPLSRPDDSRVPMMTWRSCAYTITALEWYLRDVGKPLLGDFSSRQEDCIDALVRVTSILGSVWNKEQVINNHGLKLLQLILDGNHCVLDWDCFGVLVPLTMALPNLFYPEKPTPLPLGTAIDCYTLRLIFTAHITQIILTCNLDPNDFMDDNVIEDASDFECLRNIIKILRGMKNDDEIYPYVAWKQIQRLSRPFLRSAVIFYHFLTGVPAPPCLTEVGGDTYENMCRYLGLPTSCKELLDHESITKLITKWSEHKKIREIIHENKTYPFRDLLAINQLVNLPEDYSELINTVSLFTCPNSDHEDSRNPTMCLVCGEMLCSQSYCCQTEISSNTLVGACNYHAHTCGAGVGIFLRVRECEVLLLATPNRGCFLLPPYLDDYGETDQGLRRGNPLHLCHERYKKLKLLWLSHGIHEEISRSVESIYRVHNLQSTQWQHL